MARAEAAQLRVQVVYAARPHALDCSDLVLPAGATLADALQASGLAQRVPAEEWAQLKPGIWGRAQPLDTPVRDGDRVELYRPLRVDPKEARRLRYRRDALQRAKGGTAGRPRR